MAASLKLRRQAYVVLIIECVLFALSLAGATYFLAWLTRVSKESNEYEGLFKLFLILFSVSLGIQLLLGIDLTIGVEKGNILALRAWVIVNVFLLMMGIVGSVYLLIGVEFNLILVISGLIGIVYRVTSIWIITKYSRSLRNSKNADVFKTGQVFSQSYCTEL